MRTRVLIVDDHAPFRDAARAALAVVDDFQLVGEATSGEEAIALTESLRPDIVVMDIVMNGIDGIEAARSIAAARPETRTILVSTYRAEELPRGTWTCGAAAFLHKSEFGSGRLRELCRTRSTVSRGRPDREALPSHACEQPSPRRGRA